MNKNVQVIGSIGGPTTIQHPSVSAFVPNNTNTGNTGAAYRISGFTFTGSTSGDLINFNGGNPNQGGASVPTGGTAWAGFFRVDHITYNYSSSGNVFIIYGPVFGLFDHITGTTTANHFEQANFINSEYNATHSGTYTQMMGEYSQRILSAGFGSSAPGGIGSQYMDFIEDSSFNCPGNYSGAASDSESGGQRMVFRYSTLSGTCFWYAHWTRGNEIDGDLYEIYNNTNTGNSNGQYPMRFGSGTGVIFNNSFPGTWSDKTIKVDETRGCGGEVSDSPMFDCNGSRFVDGNAGDASAPGWPCAGQIGTAFLNGNGTRGASNSLPLRAWSNGTQTGCATGGSCTNAFVIALDGPQGSSNSCSRSMSAYIKSTPHTVSGPLNGAVDICQGTTGKPTSCGTYSDSYTPYIYPHPLQAAGGGTLTLSTNVTGAGSITGCAGSTYHAGDPYSCNLNPAPGSSITSASGCGGSLSGSVFSGHMTSSCVVSATFTVNSFTFTLTKLGTGNGTIAGANCSTGSYPSSTAITCTQTPAAGSTFIGWGGACSGTGGCSVTLASNQAVTATFQGTAAQASFTPPAGSYGSAQSVVLTTTTPSATIYYTTNGSTPTHASAVYSSPIAVASSLTIKALVAAPGYTDSGVSSAAYTINGAVADPVLSPAPGAYGSAQTVTITTATSGASIRYTLDGSEPSCSTSTLYTGPVTISTSHMLGAIGCKSGFSDSNPVGGTYLINGAVPPTLHTPGSGAYAGSVVVTITDPLQDPTIIFTANAGSNGNASNGDTPSRNFYTNCATGHSGSGGSCQVLPANSGIVSHGQRWCNASQVVADGCNGFGTAVVGTSSTGVGVHQLDNGFGAGGDDSALSTSQSFGGTSSNACSTIPSSVPSGTQPGLTIPGYTSGTTEVISLTSQSSNFNTSYLGPTKWVGLWDAADHYVRYLCQRVSTTTGSGLHLEFDLNHNISTGIYYGPGLHYDWSTQKIYYCYQGCSSWRPITLNDGTDHTTFAFPANHDLGFEIKYRRNPGCTPSSGSNCQFIDKMCIQDLTAGAVNKCYTAKDAATGLPVGGIPVSKTTWTRNEVTLQHQIDENGASISETATIAFDNVIGYANPTVTIYYTTDGSTPTTSSTVYSGPITISTTTVLKSIAVAPGYTNSTVTTGTYTINGQTADPVFSPTGGTFTTPPSVTITDSTPGSSVHFTADGSTPTSASPIYVSPSTISVTTTIKALGVTPGFANSNVITNTYLITGTVAAPTFTPPAGTFATTQNVTIATATPGATIRYTTSGTAPTCSTGTVYTTPVAISSTVTLKAIGCESGWLDSTVTSGLYTINGQVATPTFTPGAGTYTGTQSVTIASATSGATIYYTTNGATPTTGSTLYTGPVSVSVNLTLKALAVKATFTDSGIGSAAYVINPVPPTITGIVAGLGHVSGLGSLK